VFLNRFSRPGLRALRTGLTSRLERDEQVDLSVFGRVADLYFGGDMEASIALTGQVAGRIDSIETVRDIVHGTVRGFRECLDSLSRHH
jgi:enoyl-[acyl-carrier protein] reductase II